MSKAWEEALLDAERRYGSRGGHLLRRGLAKEPKLATHVNVKGVRHRIVVEEGWPYLIDLVEEKETAVG